MTGPKRRRRLNWADRRGATAVEFALVLPPFILLVVGGFYLAGICFAKASLQYSVQAAARCASVNATQCPSTTATATYASSLYLAPGFGAPTFTASSASCGHLVSGSATFAFNTGWATTNVPLTATACFP